jgi:hypothetical protein
MPAKSAKQEKFMQAVANNPKVCKKSRRANVGWKRVH